jgi:hypothetical protein
MSLLSWPTFKQDRLEWLQNPRHASSCLFFGDSLQVLVSQHNGRREEKERPFHRGTLSMKDRGRFKLGLC